MFAVHPLHVESVAWVTERKDVLSTFFWALTVWAYIGYVRAAGGRQYRGVVGAVRARRHVEADGGDAVRAVLLLLDIWPLRRVSSRRGTTGVDPGSPREASAACRLPSAPASPQ